MGGGELAATHAYHSPVNWQQFGGNDAGVMVHESEVLCGST